MKAALQLSSRRLGISGTDKKHPEETTVLSLDCMSQKTLQSALLFSIDIMICLRPATKGQSEQAIAYLLTIGGPVCVQR
jgi:hypothetical protein